ncbi:putative DNA binding domain-containing protein [Clostridium sp. SYSU_GA19001]|uniref:AlbA family DNA-binding domain-containing protein n=1 Tax=Clostridium caldaquaticum TaxID=2940653 RepID=UPI002076FAC5|nr:RNA-binding domain-containing protein [Clostridium caldaquaticum]MCM8711854.1 putative DNA binding domain-containing protein [Clostridium caldaquaticum]
MDIRKFNILLKREEGPKLDFKQKLDLEIESGRKELAKDVCAIANSKGGRGYIIIGIEDKTKKVIGIEGKGYEEEQIMQIVTSRCEPPIPIAYENFVYDGKKLGIITIYDGGQKPYQIRDNGAFYIRRGSTTDTMRKQEIAAALEESLSLNIELCPIINSSVNCIDTELVDKYFAFHKIEANKENRIILMENASIIRFDKDLGKFVATLGGILVFSKINSVYIPHNMVRIVNKINREEDEIIIINGDLLSILDTCEDTLKRLLPVNYPVEALFEGVKNAVLYRDYTIFYKEIEIILSYDSISVISPGILVKGKDISDHNYIKRNMWIYEKIIALDDKKRFIKQGRGFSRMKKAFKNIGRIMFINSLNGDFFKVVYPGIGKIKN